MKTYTLLFLIAGLVWSCNDDDSNPANNDLVGQWKLIEGLADPGDGSGTFVEVESEKRITFNADGTLTSNGSLCDMTIDATTPTSGTYSIEDSNYVSDDCPNPELAYHFEQNGNILIIDYPCVEPCRAKYEKQ